MYSVLDVLHTIHSQKKTGRQLNLCPGDLKIEQTAIDSVKNHVKQFGGLDILVNNAAQQLENRDITTLPSDQWEDTFKVNIHSYFYTSKAALPHMKKGSSIINMCMFTLQCEEAYSSLSRRLDQW